MDNVYLRQQGKRESSPMENAVQNNTAGSSKQKNKQNQSKRNTQRNHMKMQIQRTILPQTAETTFKVP
uniref:Uncharacterized protein n=1 Tax=Pristionchus pacificus TaxID=54126 RepID=A0A2A6C463_PRIPA|eukprot:PDM72919.1 hypothetical protein PRIPAC_39353 [Pristionchus pacificus]